MTPVIRPWPRLSCKYGSPIFPTKSWKPPPKKPSSGNSAASSPDGQVDVADKTRTGLNQEKWQGNYKDVNLSEVTFCLLYDYARTGNQDTLAAAKRIIERRKEIALFVLPAGLPHAILFRQRQMLQKPIGLPRDGHLRCARRRQRLNERRHRLRLTLPGRSGQHAQAAVDHHDAGELDAVFIERTTAVDSQPRGIQRYIERQLLVFNVGCRRFPDPLPFRAPAYSRKLARAIWLTLPGPALMQAVSDFKPFPGEECGLIEYQFRRNR